MIGLLTGQCILLSVFLATPELSAPPRGARPQVRTATAAQRDQRGELIAKRRAKKNAAIVSRRRREAISATIEAQAAQARAAQAERMLPYQLEAQRQMLQRQSELERNAAYHRMAGALERLSGYYTPANSGVRVLPPQVPPYLAPLIP